MDQLSDWKKAGRIAGEVLQYGKSLIQPGASYLEVTEKIEQKIKELGAEPAFPPQMSLNDVAAHFTVDPGEDITFKDQLVCLDVGVHVNGAIGDTALTVDLSGKNEKLVKASQDALQQAIAIIQRGERSLSIIGKTVQNAITSHGFLPIRNLSGHGLSLYDVHDIPTIPNIDTGEKTELQKDGIYAIEPFASAGAGLIYETDKANIFSVVEKKPVRSQITREVLKAIEAYHDLPFTTRWLAKKFPLMKVNFALRELQAVGMVRAYPPLIDKNHGLVSQAEHTIFIDQDGNMEILTKID